MSCQSLAEHPCLWELFRWDFFGKAMLHISFPDEGFCCLVLGPVYKSGSRRFPKQQYCIAELHSTTQGCRSSVISGCTALSESVSTASHRPHEHDLDRKSEPRQGSVSVICFTKPSIWKRLPFPFSKVWQCLATESLKFKAKSLLSKNSTLQ